MKTVVTKRIDWSLIKPDYLARIPLDQISRKYGVSIETLRTRIKRDQWAEEKKQLEAEALLKVRGTYVDCLVEYQVKARDRYIMYYIELSHKIIGMSKSCQDPKLLVLLMNALEQCQSGEFKALAINDKSNEYLGRYVDHRETVVAPPQPANDIDKAIEILKNNPDGVLAFFKTIYEYARLKGVDVQAMMDKMLTENTTEDNKPGEPH